VGKSGIKRPAGSALGEDWFLPCGRKGSSKMTEYCVKSLYYKGPNVIHEDNTLITSSPPKSSIS
jgi:hypothetical protein